LGIERNIGLSTYLIGEANAPDIVRAYSQISNFSVIPSGPIPPNPSELISSPKLDKLFIYLKQHFDYIVIDSPPTSAVTDAKILASVADATLYIMRQNYTDSSFIELINSLQQKKAFPNLNIVFNGIKVKKIIGYHYGNSYGYGYGYGSGYYSDDDPKGRGKS
jgi:capsular exopolysaccharide synthesis family protein